MVKNEGRSLYPTCSTAFIDGVGDQNDVALLELVRAAAEVGRSVEERLLGDGWT